ncbi:MAG: leucine-rich repeat domain-containing protein [Clostridia bacterium]|nr:leucine-rich repeat domain-containing protein [Clostridia bacterium]
MLTRRALCLLLTLTLLTAALPAALAEELSLDSLLADIELAAEEEPKALTVGPLSFDISEDRQSIFIDKPEVTGSDEYRIAYNIYDADSNPVNYFYSLEDRVAATPGYGGLFNVFVVVTDVTGAQNTQNIGWQTLSWPLADSLSVGRATFTLSEDRKSVYVDRPEIHCKSGSVSIAYNIYDDQSNPVNYFYSTEKRVAATPGYSGKFNVFIVVTDTVTGEQDVQNIGWQVLGDPQEEPEEPEEDDPADYDYILYASYVKVTGYRGNKADIVIPSVIEDRPVREIGDQAFFHQYGLVSVRIPRTVTTIGEWAFGSCTALEEVIIPDSVTVIKKNAFERCTSLPNITLPKSLTDLGGMAFLACEKLQTIALPDSLAHVGRNPFCSCSSLTGITLSASHPALTVDDGVLISKADHRLICCLPARTSASYAIPEGVAVIDESAFSDCANLTSLTMPDTVTDIGEYAFTRCAGLTDITLSAGLTLIRRFTFWDCSGLTRITIPASVTELEEFALNGPVNLKEINYLGTAEQWAAVTIGFEAIPEGVTVVFWNGACGPHLIWKLNDGTLIVDGTGDMFDYEEEGAPWYDVRLTVTKVILRDGVTGVGACAFMNCHKLNNLTLPSGLKRIGRQAFQTCNVLLSLTIPESVVSIGDYAFERCRSIKYDLVVPGSVTSIGDYAFANCGQLRSINMYYGVKTIGDFAFAWCEDVRSISLPATVTSVGEAVFKGCKHMAGGSGLIVLWHTLYGGKKDQVTADIPEEVVRISGYAFEDITTLTSVTIPSGVHGIGPRAFAGCTGLTSLTIPDSVTGFGQDIFAGCAEGFVIRCNPGSAAEKYARDNGIAVEAPEQA